LSILLQTGLWTADRKIGYSLLMMTSSDSPSRDISTAPPVRVGIVGLGFMGRTHLELYRRSGRAEVVAVADADPVRLRLDEGGAGGNLPLPPPSKDPAPFPDPQRFADGMALIRGAEVDLVDICLPLHLHKAFVRAALEAGRHVLCEKPLTRSVGDAEELFLLAAQRKRMLMNGLCLRFWPAYQWTRAQWRRGEWGRRHQAFFKRLSPHPGAIGAGAWLTEDAKSGGALLEMHLHDIDQIRWLFGRPESVHCFGCRGVRSADCWDHVFTRYDFGDGSLVTAEGGWTAAGSMPFDMQFQIIADKATVRFDGSAVTVYREDGATTADLSGFPQSTGWEGELHALLDALQAGRSVPPVPPQEVLDGLCIAEAERLSADSGAAVQVRYRELPEFSETPSPGVTQ
jgi:predicted dehydrogenase